jgi:DNA-binding NtrC family response regulator
VSAPILQLFVMYNSRLSSNILIVDDDADARTTLVRVLEKEGYSVTGAASAEEALTRFEKTHFDLVLTDMRMNGMGGIELLRALKARRSDVPVIIMTAFASIDTAVQAIDERAYDYLRKPYQLAEIRASVRRALAHAELARENRQLKHELVREAATDRIVGTSPGMVEVYKVIARVAKSDTTILITGESGTGKEMVARAVHRNSLRGAKPFLAVNCGALSETLLESELFGHVRGAFTGATASRKGLFESAQEGTVFLDEISETSPAMQTKLLRVLEEREITRVGSMEPIRVDVRVIAATNRSMSSLVKDGKFREDLFYRLHVVEIVLPPLRERISDLPLLFAYFLDKYSRKLGKTLAVAPGLVDETLTKYSWPGNVRELENLVERAVTLNHTGILNVEDLPVDLRKAPDEMHRDDKKLASLEEIEAQHVKRVIAAVDGNMTRAAEVLNVDRRTLYRMIDRFGLWTDRLRKNQPDEERP